MAWPYHERRVRQFIFHDDNFLVPQVERNPERVEALVDQAEVVRHALQSGKIFEALFDDVHACDRLAPADSK
jgi:hypothetical protein